MMKQFFSICIFLFGPFLISAQSSESIGYRALVDLEWLIFNSDSSTERDSLLFLKAQEYRSMEDFESALQTLERINLLVNGSIEEKVVNEQILLHFLLKNSPEVENLLLQTSFIDGYEKSKEVKLIETINYVRLYEIDQAKESFTSMNLDSEQIEKVFDTKSFRDPSKAFTYSFILPGSGQMYAGKFFKGLLSMGINAGLFYTGFNGIRRGYIFTEAVTGIALFQGFYFGGAEFAKELAHERNEQIVERVSQNIINTLK